MSPVSAVLMEFVKQTLQIIVWKLIAKINKLQFGRCVDSHDAFDDAFKTEMKPQLKQRTNCYIIKCAI